MDSNHRPRAYQARALTDEPGVIGKIASMLGEKNINIIDLRAPQCLKSGNSLAVFKTNVAVPELLIERIQSVVNAKLAFQIEFGN